LTFKLVRARDKTRLPGEFGENLFLAVPEIFHTQAKSHRQRQKQNLTQFTVRAAVITWATLAAQQQKQRALSRKSRIDKRGSSLGWTDRDSVIEWLTD